MPSSLDVQWAGFGHGGREGHRTRLTYISMVKLFLLEMALDHVKGPTNHSSDAKVKGEM